MLVTSGNVAAHSTAAATTSKLQDRPDTHGHTYCSWPLTRATPASVLPLTANTAECRGMQPNTWQCVLPLCLPIALSTQFVFTKSAQHSHQHNTSTLPAAKNTRANTYLHRGTLSGQARTHQTPHPKNQAVHAWHNQTHTKRIHKHSVLRGQLAKIVFHTLWRCQPSAATLVGILMLAKAPPKAALSVLGRFRCQSWPCWAWQCL